MARFFYMTFIGDFLLHIIKAQFYKHIYEEHVQSLDAKITDTETKMNQIRMDTQNMKI